MPNGIVLRRVESMPSAVALSLSSSAIFCSLYPAVREITQLVPLLLLVFFFFFFAWTPIK
jgi:ABC-type polysaccharide/polyol phosphate export permease